MLIESFGTLAKEELLKTIEHNIIPNTFVLENDGPFPGYHGSNLPSDKKPESIFLVINKKQSAESIFRIADNIRKITDLSFDACFASICIHNDTYNCIRIRSINDFTVIPKIQSCFMDFGIKFLKRKSINAKGIISLKKIFVLERINDKVFRNITGDLHYLKLNRQLSWNHFKQLTYKVKNNVSYAKFDAALAVVYGSQVHDLVRIFSKGIEENTLEEIHSKYIELLNKAD